MPVAEVAVRRNGRHVQTSPPRRINIGGGETHLPGFENYDRKLGKEAYPLDVEDESLDEILASHVFEHFSFKDSESVLKNWVAKLKPGGRIRIAVPDFEQLAKCYLNGDPIHLQGFILGGNVDENDRHGAIYDREWLTELMLLCGLERISEWRKGLVGTAAMPFSLNLQGFKPSRESLDAISNIRAVVSTPRFGPLLHPECARKAFMQLGIEGTAAQSCFWNQQISNLMEDAIANPECNYVLTLDFDTVFSADDVKELYRLMQGRPDVDAVFPVQAKRGCMDALFSLTNADGTLKHSVSEADLARQLLPANTGHFGLTMFRAESLRKFPRPWMLARPNESGQFNGGHVDPDIDFWANFKKAGFQVCLAPRVVVGHIEEVISWPDPQMKRVYQMQNDYFERGIPAEVAR